MKSKSDFIRYISLAAIFLIAGVLIYQTYPNIGKFRYTYVLDKPWEYDALTAPYGFEIMKSKEELKSEEDSLLKDFHPFYQNVESIPTKYINLLNSNFGKVDDSAVGEYKTYIIRKLKTLYSNGIIDAEEMENLNDKGITEINILTGNVAKSVPIASLQTAKSAYENIINNAPISLDRLTLQGYNINNYIQENIVFDKEKTESVKKEALKSISLTKGRIQSGEKIIDHGEIVKQKTYDILNSLKTVVEENSGKKDAKLIHLGQILIILNVLCALFLYFLLFRRSYLMTPKNIALILSIIVILCFLTSFTVKKEITPYIIPYALLPILVTCFFDTRTALFSHLTVILLASFVVPNGFEFLLMQTIVGMISICTLKNIYMRSQLVQSALFIIVTYCTVYAAYTLVHENGMDTFEWKMPFVFLANGLLLLFAYPLIYIVEKLFGYVSDVTLVELANTNNTLLRQFSEEAPGSFQHSMQVSNLASDAARSIGANPMLARTGALYHDIGKMANPAFFTENQSSKNPHTEMNDEEKSAQIIIRHVTDGIAIAKKNGLPEKIQEFIATHHGKSKTKYFFYTMKNKYPDREIDEAKFTYPGPLPTSKEMAILVMCDAVEAASRSLKEYTDTSINDLVEKIVNDQVSEGIFNETPITFKEINKIKEVLKGKLTTIYHTRIVYPELNKK